MCKTIPGRLTPMLLFGVMCLIGCDTQDGRLQQLSQESLNRQAEQNVQMGRQSQQVTETTRRLIDAQEQGRKELTGLQKAIQAERANVTKQYDNLQQERKELARDQHREPIIANAILSAAVLLAAILPLVLACYLIKSVYHDHDEAAISDLLIMDLASERPLLSPPSQSGLRGLQEQRPVPIDHSARLPAPVVPSAHIRSRSASACVFVVVEGRHDIEFLKRISRILHVNDGRIPDLARLEQENQVIFIPTGGGDLESWTRRFAGLELREFHLYDREVPPLTLERQQTINQINRRAGCKAVLTGKRAIENYLHPEAIFAASGIELEFDDESNVPERFASAKLEIAGGVIWSKLPRRGRRRTRDQAKRVLNTIAVEMMTPQLLQERDPNNDVIGWLNAVAEMIRDSPASAGVSPGK